MLRPTQHSDDAYRNDHVLCSATSATGDAAAESLLIGVPAVSHTRLIPLRAGVVGMEREHRHLTRAIVYEVTK